MVHPCKALTTKEGCRTGSCESVSEWWASAKAQDIPPHDCRVHNTVPRALPLLPCDRVRNRTLKPSVLPRE